MNSIRISLCYKLWIDLHLTLVMLTLPLDISSAIDVNGMHCDFSDKVKSFVSISTKDVTGLNSHAGYLITSLYSAIR